MRGIALLLLVLLVAGCTQPAAQEHTNSATPVTPSSPTVSAAASASSPASGTQPAPAANQSAAQPATAPSSPANASAPAPAAPAAPRQFNLSESTNLGYLAGLPASAPQQPGTDAADCPDANMTVPDGATNLTVTFKGDPAGVNGVGLYSLDITPPNGKTDTLAADPSKLTPNAPVTLTKQYASSVSGAWRFHATSDAASAKSDWTLTLAISGASLAPPTSVAFGHPSTCSTPVPP